MRIIKFLIPGMLVIFTAGASGAPAPTVRDFGWLAGHWCLSARGEFVEEHWLMPRGDMMLGSSRTVRDGKTTSFEFLRIVFQPAVSYVAQPGGASPTSFALTASGAEWARFENPQHDFPTRVEYRRVKSGLHAEIAGPGAGGKEQVIGFDYRSCQATPPT
jgi:hypothetical protein